MPLVVKREGCCQFNLTIEAKHRGVLVRADSPGETFYSWLIFHHCKIGHFLLHLHHYHPQETGRNLDLICSKRILALHTILGKGAQQLIMCLIESTNQLIQKLIVQHKILGRVALQLIKSKDQTKCSSPQVRKAISPNHLHPPGPSC